MLDVAIAPLLWRLDHYGNQARQDSRAAHEVRRAHLLAPASSRALTPSEKVMRK